MVVAALGWSLQAQAQSITVSGPGTVGASTTVQFNANVQGIPNQGLVWSVNGVVWGNAQLGFVDNKGLYRAPLSVPSNPVVQVLAASPYNNWQYHGYVYATLTNPVPQVSTVMAGFSGGQSYTVDVAGANFVRASAITVNGQAQPSRLIANTHLRATIQGSPSQALSVGVINPYPGGGGSNQVNVTLPGPGALTASAAGRLLEQGTFGPTLGDIQHVQQVGLSNWLNEQFNVQPSLMIPSESQLTAALNQTEDGNDLIWWRNVLTGQDQLRQRVAFALSNIFVVSYAELDSHTIPYYVDLLTNDAFGNFYNLMRDVTLSPAMGVYLNMVNNSRSMNGQIPNENFAREMMQLFTLGPNLLNQDGTLQMDGNGKPIPTYTQDQVQAFARAYTGWTYWSPSGNFWAWPYYTAPMVPVNYFHDSNPKALLNGTVLPGGQSATADLNGALQNIFNHPNLPPFVCRQLIQHLVVSNPSPEYVERVAAVFINNGQGVRGDLKAVVAAILSDPEARAGDSGNVPSTAGKLREPILWQTAALRGLGFVPFQTGLMEFQEMSGRAGWMNQLPMRAPSVFNFFPPSNQAPGTNLAGPEFALETTNLIPSKYNFADQIVWGWMGNMYIDLTPGSMWGQAALASNDALLDQLNLVLMHGQMPQDMRTSILNAMNGVTDIYQKTRIAAYLVITSPQFRVIH